MVLAAPGPLLTPPPSSAPPKTPHRSYSAQIRSQNEEKKHPPQTVPAPTDEQGIHRVGKWWVQYHVADAIACAHSSLLKLVTVAGGGGVTLVLLVRQQHLLVCILR
jgi:hypothetical protein